MNNWTEADLAAHQKRVRSGPKRDSAGVVMAKATNTRPVKLNKLEARYMALLEARKQAGEIAWYGVQCWTFKLADDTRFTPDFPVILADGTVEVHETKGFMRDDARVKLMVAACTLYPFFVWKLVKWDKGQWDIKRI